VLYLYLFLNLKIAIFLKNLKFEIKNPINFKLNKNKIFKTLLSILDGVKPDNRASSMSSLHNTI